MNDEAATKFGKNFQFYLKTKQFFTYHPTFNHFASTTKILPSTLNHTISTYNNCSQSPPDEFNKKYFPVTFNTDEPIYSAIITPVLHYSMGGLKINEFSQVINEAEEPIEGLFAAGEVTGGVHGDNRLGGNSLLECVVYGKIAAEQANLMLIK